jgi:hypothetical protein
MSRIRLPTAIVCASLIAPTISNAIARPYPREAGFSPPWAAYRKADFFGGFPGPSRALFLHGEGPATKRGTSSRGRAYAARAAFRAR